MDMKISRPVPIQKSFHLTDPVNPNQKVQNGNKVGNTGNIGSTPIYMFICYQSL